RAQASGSLVLWNLIERSTKAMSFQSLKAFLDFVMCDDRTALDRLEGIEPELIQERKQPEFGRLARLRSLPYTDTDAYRLLKAATEAFVTVNCGVFERATDFDEDTLLRRAGAESADLNTLWNNYLKQINGTSDRTLPYLMLVQSKLGDDRLLDNIISTHSEELDAVRRLCYGTLREKLHHPCFLELIWSYWEEQGLLVQTMNVISRRFQNVRAPGERDPLAELEIDPLRPLNNLVWGYVQDEQHRLSLVRRAYEYDHHYGLRLEGKAVPPLTPADSRSRFLESFHNLINVTAAYYKQADDLTIRADAFPVLNALKDLHLVVTEGAHNQFGDLPVTARIEMLMQQWLLARPEFREFLPTRVMVAYPEPWMDRVDAMKRLQGWDNTTITHYHNLAVFGEQLLLSVRYGAWSGINDANEAEVWANFWRPQVQGYGHAYKAVTSVNLVEAATVQSVQQQRVDFTTQPSQLIHARAQRTGNGTSANGRTPVAVQQPPTSNLRRRKAASQSSSD
ncbi:MAG: hypothetical protein ACK2UK_06320, partial [Candidatus Promineifilaceae bacterium]